MGQSKAETQNFQLTLQPQPRHLAVSGSIPQAGSGWWLGAAREPWEGPRARRSPEEKGWGLRPHFRHHSQHPAPRTWLLVWEPVLWDLPSRRKVDL